MNGIRAARYRKLVRWYPSAWRERNEEAIVAVLMDEDDAEGRLAPTWSNRLALMATGLHERFIAPERLSRFGLGALIVAVLFSAWYLGVIAWAPGITYAGTFGPFSNPSVIVGGILVVALVLALFSRGRTARFVALLSVPVMILIGVLSSIHSWLGPGVPAVVIFVGLGLMAASPLRSVGDAWRVVGSFLLVILGIVLTEFVLARRLAFTLDPIGIAEAGGAVVAFLVALALLWPTARNLRTTSKAA